MYFIGHTKSVNGINYNYDKGFMMSLREHESSFMGDYSIIYSFFTLLPDADESEGYNNFAFGTISSLYFEAMMQTVIRRNDFNIETPSTLNNKNYTF